MVLVVLMGMSASPAAAASDLNTGHGFYEEITYLLEQEILQGYPDDTVRPDATVTRAEAAIMIGRMQGLDGTQRDSGFSDVTARQKASGFIAEAEEAGYINGYPDGTFRPYETITRGDMAIILSRVFVTPFAEDVAFTDISPMMEAYEPIGYILGANITVGYPDNTFKPNLAVTRAQFSAFLARGQEPKFKNDARIAGSYMKDMTKTYVYESADGSTSTHQYEFVPYRINDELPLGFVWTMTDENGEHIDDYIESETRDYYGIGFPYSEFYVELVYPVETGKTFNVDSTFSPEHEITAVGVTVETAYRTFTNAVEVTVADDPDFVEEPIKYYMVEGFGGVKTVDMDGTTISELVDVR
ncbi:S-layer homology domain-containing protein [Planococcus salinus]|uniref:S-layer homology domain-containing protein n=2 Tax=Planococcus salinus TaxID=1848460 RepID=A0A3M8P7I8_9BACL|nr:S-layer homology domain-containing protein [Planococcus salinus]